jgi:hypothetical protein
MRAFADAYDAMLRGEKAVSDVAPKATMFAFFPELKGKDLPTLHEALADLIERADEAMLVGFFHHRWLAGETRDEQRVDGPLKGDLNEFVALLRRDAKDLRNGRAFGPSGAFGIVDPGTDPIASYVRSSAETVEGFGLIPTLLCDLANPNYNRETLTFGDEGRLKSPTFMNTKPGPIKIAMVARGG